MNAEAGILQTLHDRPDDDTSWLVLADCLEEHGQADQAELVRIQAQLRGPVPQRDRDPAEERARWLLGQGVLPVAPTLVNSVGMKFVLIPPGEFWMGSADRTSVSHGEERPRHHVRITRPFYLGQHQVTQRQYETVTGRNPSFFHAGYPRCKGVDASQLPVESVSAADIRTFCRRLGALEADACAGRAYRLPSEAEWEYACRAGTTTEYNTGALLGYDRANYNGYYPEDDPTRKPPGRALGRTSPVGIYPPNLFGLYDMHGNVWEWCSDWYADDYYEHSPPADPPGPEAGSRRVLRGGGWSAGPDLCRSALRGHNTEDARHNYNGFRLVLTTATRPRKRK